MVPKMVVARICRRCGYIGRFKSRFSLTDFMILLILGIIPGLIYAILRGDSWKCPRCGNTEGIKRIFICDYCAYKAVIQEKSATDLAFAYGLDPSFGVIYQTIKREVRCPRCEKAVERV